MANLIDKTYFIGEINIAQLSQSAVVASLTLFIDKREPEYLKRVLGYAFWKLFNAAIADTDGKWYDLRVGAEYENADGFTKKWPGFVNADLLSPIANYVYYWYTRDLITFTSGAGEKASKSDNAGNANPDIKLMRAWNEMVRQTEMLYDFLLNKKEAGVLVYDEFSEDEVDCFKRISILGL